MARYQCNDWRRSGRASQCGSAAPRRGIVLLFVLALLALFSLVTVTFVLVARQGKQSTLVDAAAERNTEPYEAQLEGALFQALRGTANPISAMRTHSLLEDMYGSDAVTGTIVDGQLMPDRTTAVSDPMSSAVNPQYAVGQQVQKFLVQLDVNLNAPLYQYSGAYNGRTVTMLSGAAAGRSSRILESTAPYGKAGLPVTAPSATLGPTHMLDVVTFGANLAIGDRVLINGGAFNGTGFGYGFNIPPPPSRPTLFLGAKDQYGSEYALLPNPVFFSPNITDSSGMGATVTPWYSDPAGPGGADEPYDAVDFQNMLLALHVPSELLPGGTGVTVPIPSLHRPELIYYWYARFCAVDGTTPKPMDQVVWSDLANLFSGAPLRRIMLRPNPLDHPQFTGSNPGFRPCSLGSTMDIGRWDVDNNNDGVADSVWVDLGSEVRTAPDGKKYKPLYALLVIDQDGKFNLNAQGSPQHVYHDGMTPPSTRPVDILSPADGNRVGPYAGMGKAGIVAPTDYLATGQGYGPGDINLRFLFEPVGANIGEYGRLLYGELDPARTAVEGRYGEGYLVTKSPAEVPMPGYSIPAVPGSPSTGDWIDDYVRNFDMPDNYFTAMTSTPPFGSYGSPPDLNANSALGLDARGLPWYGDIYNMLGGGQTFTGLGEYLGTPTKTLISDKINDPYEIDLSPAGRQKTYTPSAGVYSTVDNPFTPEDLERILRFNDVDSSSLSGRLLQLAPVTFQFGNGGNPIDAAYRRGLISTEGWDVPVPSAALTPDQLVREFSTATTPENATSKAILDAMATPPSPNPTTSVSFVELVRRRLSEAGFNLNDRVSEQMALRQLVSWDLMRGERLDLNRILGNALDGNGNNVVDDPIEAGAELARGGVTSEMGNPELDLNNDGVVGVDSTSALPGLADKDDHYARQLLARHLYVLAWSLVDVSGARLSGNATPTPPADTTFDAMAPLVNASANDPQKVREAMAQRLAQWAVNMVDYRDRDSIMTGFEYDVYPFSDESSAADGLPWDTDDDLTTNESTANPAIVRGVVWGVERPELLITETFAFHNKRTNDLSSPGGKVTDATPDVHLDQVKRPLGGLIFELYAPWNRTEAPSRELTSAAPAVDHYSVFPATWQVNLSKLAPSGAPVWRIVVTKDSELDKQPERDDWSGATPPTGTNTNIERTVYFIPEPADMTTFPVQDHRRPYFRDSSATTDVLIYPNTYAVVGPADDTNRTDLWDENGGPGKVTLNMTETAPFDMTGLPVASPYPTSSPSASAQIKRARPIIINSPRRLSISEPYPAEGTLPADPGNDKYAAWEAGMPMGSDVPITPADDIPWDFASPELPPQDGTTKNNASAGANSSWRTIYVQRLADPTRPWHRQTNPYLSVDRMPVDLTVYNSETNVIPPGQPATDPFRWASRQRGKLEIANHAGGPVTTFNIWANNPCERPASGDPDANNFKHTFGYLNDPARVFVDNPSGLAVSMPLRLVNGTPGAGELANPYTGTGDEYLGDLSTPFPWLTWANRPYISKHELLNVPAVRPHELLAYHSTRKPIPASALPPPTSPTSPAGATPYGITGQLRPTPEPQEDIFTGLQFGYLSPFYMSSWYAQSATLQYTLPNFHRMLEFVTVPSRFAGTEMYLNSAPSYFASVSGGGTPSGHRYNPPFNRINLMREPGKLNLNTITDIRVWQGLMNLIPDGSTGGVFSEQSWNKMVVSRRGYGPNAPASSPARILNPIDGPPVSAAGTPLPTFFANPFRSYAGLYMVPIAEMQRLNFTDAPPPALTKAHPSGTGVWQNEIDATLMRADPQSLGATKIPAPLFSASGTSAGETVKPYASTVANPYFHYQQIEKLSNLVTTRSNVYAVWITVGYFEVERGPVDDGHPDGWRLKAELGSDTGEIKRHRAFYLIDRSIPVGFQRGQDHNVQQTILLKRIIE